MKDLPKVADRSMGEAWRQLAIILGVAVPSAFKYDYSCQATAPKLIWPYNQQNAAQTGTYTYLKRSATTCVFTNYKY